MDTETPYYTTCLLDVKMDRLRVANPIVYEWINTVEIIDFDKELDARIYKAIVNDARNGITGCIRAVPYKHMDVCTEAIRGLSDVAMMHNALKDM